MNDHVEGDGFYMPEQGPRTVGQIVDDGLGYHPYLVEMLDEALVTNLIVVASVIKPGTDRPTLMICPNDTMTSWEMYGMLQLVADQIRGASS